mgnify:FL=1
MKRNKDKVYNFLKVMSLDLCNNKKRGVTASEISKELNIKRNVASHLLNELYMEGKAIKINTRPVYFIDRDAYENNSILQKTVGHAEIGRGTAVEKYDPFDKIIGSHGSLREQVKMCKSAATYPPDGLPLLLIGNSGTGKSFMAQVIYEYAKNNKIIAEDAPYVIFNCAEYADNPELLSANLFGFVKGAFTGADKDKIGLLEEANGGYLFLDEVHRLTPEGQEKLFLFLDKGIFRRLGESNNWRSSKVRFIFATTEEPSLSLINTFLRRIPLVVSIPDLFRRPVQEKLQMIYNFYQEESKNIGIDIVVSKQVMDVLLKINISGNIGKLKNAIKYSCASAYGAYVMDSVKILKIHLYDLPAEIKTKVDFILTGSIFSSMFVSKDIPKDYAPNDIFEDSTINKETEVLLDSIRDYKNNKTDIRNFKKKMTTTIDKVLDKIIFEDIENYNDTVFYNETKKVIQNILKIMENLYGIRYYGNASIVFTYLINIMYDGITKKLEGNYDFEAALNIIEDVFPKEFLIAKKMTGLIEVNLDMKTDRLILIYFTLYINTFNQENNGENITAVIISHGYSTASSIASVANRLLRQFIFEAFDMPIEMSIQEIMHKICSYLKGINTSSGVIILVDMGSLEEIYRSIGDIVNGDIGIVNNITTQLAIGVGNKIIRGEELEKVVSESVAENNNRYKFIKYNRNKKDAIIVTCMTGIGVAVKIRDLFAKCLMDNNIEIIAYDYNKLKGNGTEDKIFKEYEVKLIIGTINPGIQEIQYLSLEDLILSKGYSALKKALKNIAGKEDVEKINQAIVKLFSLQNVIENITILNSNKIIDQVEIIINDLERRLKKYFTNDLKISLYIHISCLIERLVMKEPIMSYKGLDEFKQCHGQFINYVEESFSVIADVYKIEIPVSEIAYIYDIINLKISDLKL